MEYEARVEQTGDGDWVARCADLAVAARGLSPANALDRLRLELRYRLELCPCSGVDDDYVELNAGRSW